ncbi:flavodoxin family protein [Amphritea sp. 1_MG-2023]|uniref:flavodoxin family protein n=1 Tax=Amphritea sp. 1_MG-2023 TaxID=3062670 RepID=UPI0026E374A5|nr:flavodoxin family protein [Amphritea sp. 1_MG-2023]MDO6563804.1 flavodoxin family protein [Amphritea sp. 1_MG-2023]
MSDQVKVAIAYHSGYGHTEVLAQAVAAGVENAGAVAITLSVADLDAINWDTLADTDAIIFGSPTYMGSVSGPFKCFMDATSKVWYAQGWKDKLAAGFTNSASLSGDKLNSLIQLSVFAAQHSMLWVSLGVVNGNNNSKGDPQSLNRVGGYLGSMATSNADEGPELAPPQCDRDTAQALGARVANAAKRWKQ